MLSIKENIFNTAKKNISQNTKNKTKPLILKNLLLAYGLETLIFLIDKSAKDKAFTKNNYLKNQTYLKRSSLFIS